MLDLRGIIADHFHGLLTQQDQQRPRLHVTIQNKVTGKDAKALQAQSQLMHSIETAQQAEVAAVQVQRDLEEAKAAAAEERAHLASRGERLEAAVTRVRSELLSNAEQVGNELRQRVKEIQSVEQQERCLRG